MMKVASFKSQVKSKKLKEEYPLYTFNFLLLTLRWQNG